MTNAEHVAKIEEWVEEAAADQGISGDEVYSDIVHAYLDCEIGCPERSRTDREAQAVRRTRAAILRATGVGERTW